MWNETIDGKRRKPQWKLLANQRKYSCCSCTYWKDIHENVAAYLETSEIKRQNLKNLMLKNCYFDIIAVKEIIICFLAIVWCCHNNCIKALPYETNWESNHMLLDLINPNWYYFAIMILLIHCINMFIFHIYCVKNDLFILDTLMC